MASFKWKTLSHLRWGVAQIKVQLFAFLGLLGLQMLSLGVILRLGIGFTWKLDFAFSESVPFAIPPHILEAVVALGSIPVFRSESSELAACCYVFAPRCPSWAVPKAGQRKLLWWLFLPSFDAPPKTARYFFILRSPQVVGFVCILSRVCSCYLQEEWSVRAAHGPEMKCASHST